MSEFCFDPEESQNFINNNCDAVMGDIIEEAGSALADLARSGSYDLQSVEGRIIADSGWHHGDFLNSSLSKIEVEDFFCSYYAELVNDDSQPDCGHGSLSAYDRNR